MQEHHAVRGVVSEPPTCGELTAEASSEHAYQAEAAQTASYCRHAVQTHVSMASAFVGV